MSSLKGGKTPPRLLQDLRRYNPDRKPSNGYNVLTELAYPYKEGERQKKSGKGSCRHRWALKPNGSSDTENLPVPGTPSCSRVAAMCTECRCHMFMELDSRGKQPCPNANRLMHHFLHVSKRSEGFKQDPDDIEKWTDTELFQCTAEACSAQLTVHMYSPRLNTRWKELLVDSAQINRRAKSAMGTDPGRFEGHAIPNALTVLGNLRAYITNAMKGDHRRITWTNKKFMLSFGETSAGLLKYIGFTRDAEGWVPPEPDLSDTVPFSTESKRFLDDLDNELKALMNHQPEDDKRTAKVHFVFKICIPECMQLLSCTNYPRNPQSRSSPSESDDDDKEHPYYGGLGVVLDVHDTLITFAYNAQLLVDPANFVYYLKCLRGIGAGRKSEQLHETAAIAESPGEATMGETLEAYRAFALDMRADHLDDDHIMGVFQSRITDAPRQEAQLRKALVVIARHRESYKLEQFALNSVSTYEQALAWLGAEEKMDDSFIISMYSLKVEENSLQLQFARNCVSLIAEHRKSEALKMWLETGELGEVEMDAAQAYARLDIADRSIDDDLILSAYESAVSDQPSQVSDLNKALAAIAKDRDSNLLRHPLGSSAPAPKHALSEWPVGLENIGNTCYLNSLLQYYFTVRPLRELVLDFAKYKVDLANDTLEGKKVGSRLVKQDEVKRSQRFVVELQKLFKEMVTSNRTTVKPKHQLGRLTILSSANEKKLLRRHSTLNSERPSLGELDGLPVQGPQPASAPEAPLFDGENASIVTSPQNKTSVNEDDKSSSSTLVEKPSALNSDLMDVDQEASLSDNKENEVPENGAALLEASEGSSGLLSDAVKSGVDNPTLNEKDSIKQATLKEELSSKVPEPPNRPPPVPPRQEENHLDESKIEKEVIEMGAQQQDVTEVIDHVLFQLGSAIKAQSLDEDGEQIDQIKRLFWGKLKITTTAHDGQARWKEEWFSDIKLKLPSGPRDIYAALDAVFDVEQVVVGTSKEPQYTSISMIPPILQFYVLRTHYDQEKNYAFKVDHHLDFKETIFMDRYLEPDENDLENDLLKRRAECWKWKQELIMWEKRRAMLKKTSLNQSMPEVSELASSYLKELKNTEDSQIAIDVSPDLVAGLDDSVSRMNGELEDIESKIKTLSSNIDSQFADLRSVPYNLHSVIIHRGNVNSGHYWIYIYDFARKMWRSYNDETVQEVTDKAVVFETEKQTRPGTSSFLVYIREGLEKELTDAVCREVAESLSNQSGWNVEMTDTQSPDGKLSEWSKNLKDSGGDVVMQDSKVPAVLGHEGAACSKSAQALLNQLNDTQEKVKSAPAISREYIETGLQFESEHKNEVKRQDQIQNPATITTGTNNSDSKPGVFYWKDSVPQNYYYQASLRGGSSKKFKLQSKEFKVRRDKAQRTRRTVHPGFSTIPQQPYTFGSTRAKKEGDGTGNGAEQQEGEAASDDKSKNDGEGDAGSAKPAAKSKGQVKMRDMTPPQFFVPIKDEYEKRMGEGEAKDGGNDSNDSKKGDADSSKAKVKAELKRDFAAELVAQDFPSGKGLETFHNTVAARVKSKAVVETQSGEDAHETPTIRQSSFPPLPPDSDDNTSDDDADKKNKRLVDSDVGQAYKTNDNPSDLDDTDKGGDSPGRGDGNDKGKVVAETQTLQGKDLSRFRIPDDNTSDEDEEKKIKHLADSGVWRRYKPGDVPSDLDDTDDGSDSPKRDDRKDKDQSKTVTEAQSDEGIRDSDDRAPIRGKSGILPPPWFSAKDTSDDDRGKKDKRRADEGRWHHYGPGDDPGHVSNTGDFLGHVFMHDANEEAVASDEAAAGSDEEAVASDEAAVGSDEEAVASDEEAVASDEEEQFFRMQMAELEWQTRDEERKKYAETSMLEASKEAILAEDDDQYTRMQMAKIKEWEQEEEERKKHEDEGEKKKLKEEEERKKQEDEDKEEEENEKQKDEEERKKQAEAAMLGLSKEAVVVDKDEQSVREQIEQIERQLQEEKERKLRAENQDEVLSWQLTLEELEEQEEWEKMEREKQEEAQAEESSMLAEEAKPRPDDEKNTQAEDEETLLPAEDDVSQSKEEIKIPPRDKKGGKPVPKSILKKPKRVERGEAVEAEALAQLQHWVGMGCMQKCEARLRIVFRELGHRRYLEKSVPQWSEIRDEANNMLIHALERQADLEDLLAPTLETAVDRVRVRFECSLPVQSDIPPGQVWEVEHVEDPAREYGRRTQEPRIETEHELKSGIEGSIQPQLEPWMVERLRGRGSEPTNNPPLEQFLFSDKAKTPESADMTRLKARESGEATATGAEGEGEKIIDVDAAKDEDAEARLVAAVKSHFVSERVILERGHILLTSRKDHHTRASPGLTFEQQAAAAYALAYYRAAKNAMHVAKPEDAECNQDTKGKGEDADADVQNAELYGYAELELRLEHLESQVQLLASVPAELARERRESFDKEAMRKRGESPEKYSTAKDLEAAAQKAAIENVEFATAWMEKNYSRINADEEAKRRNEAAEQAWNEQLITGDGLGLFTGATETGDPEDSGPEDSGPESDETITPETIRAGSHKVEESIDPGAPSGEDKGKEKPKLEAPPSPSRSPSPRRTPTIVYTPSSPEEQPSHRPRIDKNPSPSNESSGQQPYLRPEIPFTITSPAYRRSRSGRPLSRSTVGRSTVARWNSTVLTRGTGAPERLEGAFVVTNTGYSSADTVPRATPPPRQPIPPTPTIAAPERNVNTAARTNPTQTSSPPGGLPPLPLGRPVGGNSASGLPSLPPGAIPYFPPPVPITAAERVVIEMTRRFSGPIGSWSLEHRPSAPRPYFPQPVRMTAADIMQPRRSRVGLDGGSEGTDRENAPPPPAAATGQGLDGAGTGVAWAGDGAGNGNAAADSHGVGLQEEEGDQEVDEWAHRHYELLESGYDHGRLGSALEWLWM